MTTLSDGGAFRRRPRAQPGGDRSPVKGKIQLVRPAERYRETFLSALREFREEGLAWWVGGDLEIAETDFGAFVAKRLADASRRTETLVPKTHLWAVSDDQFVGRISIHHELNDALRTEGGHIGYDTVPSLRGRGIATEMLRLALPWARTLGLKEVLLTCDDTNAASIRVIENNAGSLEETKALGPNRPLKRYYRIMLSPGKEREGWYPSPEGSFLCKDGPAKVRGEKPVNKKLCFVVTDKELVVSILDELASLEACYWVKHTVADKAGMFLGRCFLTDAELLGRLWDKYKKHPRLMCTLQDDDFTARFRT